MSFITLDREREVRIRNKAISLIERRYNRIFLEMMEDVTKLRTDEKIFILYAGLKHEDPSLTVEKVEELVDEYSNMAKIGDAITYAAFEAYGVSREEIEKIAKEAEEAEKNPTQAAE